MEVHAHSHTPRKKWTHYFWEFLMLFLAIFCGFLAENQREHLVEHKRENQYAKQLLSDLREDSLFYARRQDQLKKAFSGQEKFKERVVQNLATDMEILRGFLNVYWNFDARLTNTTFTQMKASGSLRYIRNYELTTQLTKYYDVLSERVNSTSTLSRDFLKEHITPWYLKHVRAQDVDLLKDSIINPNAVVIDRSKTTDQEVLNITDGYEFLNLSTSEIVDKQAARQAELLIAMIKKEYHLK
jgi:hypothetical protein